MQAVYDLLIQRGIVFDGTGAPPRVADVGVRDGRVVAINWGAAGEHGCRQGDRRDWPMGDAGLYRHPHALRCRVAAGAGPAGISAARGYHVFRG